METSREIAQEEFTPTTAAELARFVAENARERRRGLVPVGGRTALQYGGTVEPQAVAIAMGRLQRVVEYPARDMTITVEAGIRVEELQQLLSSERQRLAVDVPQSHRATLGGAIATNTSGPGRFAAGTFRDHVIGISAVDGQGRPFSAGGRVVKNVAGYDLCKLLVGSLGTLACITQVTLKLRPVPETRAIVWAPFPDLLAIDAALDALMSSSTRPAALDVLNAKAAWQLQADLSQALPAERPVLCLVFEGTEREVRWQADAVRGELAAASPIEVAPVFGETADAVYSALVEYQAASDDPVTFRATLPASRTCEFMAVAGEAGVALQAHAGNGVIYGHLPDRCADAESADEVLSPLRSHAQRHGGAVVLLSCEPSWKERLSIDRGREDAGLMRGIKEALDPHHVLSPGRMNL